MMKDRTERADLAIRRLRAMLEDELQAEGADIDHRKDAVHALAGLDHAERVLLTDEEAMTRNADDEVIEEIREAQSSAKRAFDLLRDDEE